MNYGAIKWVKNHLFVGYLSVLKKKNTNGKKIEKNYCHIRKTPYNAPPLTDAELKQAAEGSRRK
ncbi:hypothetical protein, partial [Xenorhabdus mauleonii]|uniref:hypothetical protein n=1 Tax=Xenorhabdus mauleonii TaxID=351675 RepID=UPI001C31ACB0